VSERIGIALACSECGARNYRTTKSRNAGATVERLTLKKYCSACDRHTEHCETK